MTNTWLLVDVYNLAYRAFFTSGHLSHVGNATGTLYGMFRDLIIYQERFGTHLTAFCFDHGKGLREQKYPWYKLTRRTQPKSIHKEFAKPIAEMKEQVNSLRSTYLEQLGYPNILYQNGYEADDIIASAVDCLPSSDDAIIISGDEDMYQLLSSRVSVWSPKLKRMITKQSFIKEYGIEVGDWATVKAIAGCSGDDVKGCRGVGEKTAIAYLRGEGGTKQQNKNKLIRTYLETTQFQENLEVVSLPYPGTNPFDLIRHKPPTQKAWHDLMEKLGMQTLANHDPSSVSRHLFANV